MHAVDGSVIPEEPFIFPPDEASGPNGGIFEGVCEFCGGTIKPFPSLEEQKVNILFLSVPKILQIASLSTMCVCLTHTEFPDHIST